MLPLAAPKEPAVKRLSSHVTLSDLATANDEVCEGYATWKNAPPVELYDLENDPYELANLAGQAEYAHVQERR